MAKVKTRVEQAWDNAMIGHNALVVQMDARPMEVTEDASGIIWHRYILPGGTPVVLVATPHWWNIFSPVTESAKVDDTFEAVKKLCK